MTRALCYGVFVPGTSGVTERRAILTWWSRISSGARARALISIAASRSFIVKQLGPLFGTPGGASATTPVLTRDIPHGGTMEVKGDPGYVKWPGDRRRASLRSRPGPALLRIVGARLGEVPRGARGQFDGPTRGLSPKATRIREAENSGQVRCLGFGRGGVDPIRMRAAYAWRAENLETQRLQSASDTALRVRRRRGSRKTGWLADEEHTLAGMEATPPPPLVPYTSSCRGVWRSMTVLMGCASFTSIALLASATTWRSRPRSWG